MYSFTTITVAAATLAALANAIPLAHGPKHQQLHAPRALDLEPQVVKLAPIVARQAPGYVRLDLWGGTCGGSTGFGCAPGFCCSKWGYCGTTPIYCNPDAVSYNSTTSAQSSASVSGASYPTWSAPPTNSSSTTTTFNAPAPTTYNPPAPTTTLQAPTTTAPAYSPPAYSVSTSSSSAPLAPSSYAPAPSSTSSPGGDGLGDVYNAYTGSGSTSDGWPSEDQWASFDSLWAANEPIIQVSCAQFGQDDPTSAEIDDTKSAILSVAQASGMDERFILAIMMQESKGCVRVPTTTWSHANPGLFQSYEGTGTCNPDGTGIVPCPADTITQMVKDGVQGTASGPGLQQNYEESTASGAQQYYEAARIYNSGSVSGSDLGAAGSTQCYCSDVANRLTGWTTAGTQCTLA